jgi:hypothetical protein
MADLSSLINDIWQAIGGGQGASASPLPAGATPTPGNNTIGQFMGLSSGPAIAGPSNPAQAAGESLGIFQAKWASAQADRPILAFFAEERFLDGRGAARGIAATSRGGSSARRLTRC